MNCSRIALKMLSFSFKTKGNLNITVMVPSSVKWLVYLQKVLSVKYDAVEYFTYSTTNVRI